MNDFTDHLESWWNNASVASPCEGDTIIFREARADGTHYYGIETAEEDFAGDDNTRILHHAPAPKPAWHNAIAVIAHTKGWARRRVFTRYEGSGTNSNHIWSCGNLNYGSDDLIDPAPLIEAKVTDEMVERYRDEETKWRLAGGPSHPSVANRLLTAALGIDD